MNATYQKSQTTTRVRPIYTVSKGQSRLYVPYPVTLELAIGSAHSAAASTLARCAATKKKYCSPTAQQYKMLVHTL